MTRTEEHGRVLVVEDDESAAVFVTRVLDRAGFESSWVSDADEASVLLASNRYDVLLTDFRLPGRSGLDLVQEARGAQPALGIALMTSFNEAGLEHAAISSGADDFFEKPLTPARLVARIEHLADRARLGERVPADDASVGAGSLSGPTGPPRVGSFTGPDGPVSGARSPGSGSEAGPVTADRRGNEAAGGESGGLAAVPPVFRRVGPSVRGISPVPLWASAVPVVSHLTSQAGPVTSPRTSAAWSFPD